MTAFVAARLEKNIQFLPAISSCEVVLRIFVSSGRKHNNIQKCQILTPMSFLNSLNNTMIRKIVLRANVLFYYKKGRLRMLICQKMVCSYSFSPWAGWFASVRQKRKFWTIYYWVYFSFKIEYISWRID